MADEKILIDNEQYISSGRAAKLVGYTKDYVGQLARLGKIKAKRVGRNWYINEDSINKHKVSVHYTLTKTKKKKDDSNTSITEKTSNNIDNSSVLRSDLASSSHENTMDEDTEDEEVVLFPKLQKPKRDPLLDSDIRYEEHETVKAKRHEGQLPERYAHEEQRSTMPVHSTPKSFQIQDVRIVEKRPTSINRISNQRISSRDTVHSIDGIVLTKKPRQHTYHRDTNVSYTENQKKAPVIQKQQISDYDTNESDFYDEDVVDFSENSKVFPVVGAIIIFTVITVIYILFFM